MFMAEISTTTTPLSSFSADVHDDAVVLFGNCGYSGSVYNANTLDGGRLVMTNRSD